MELLTTSILTMLIGY